MATHVPRHEAVKQGLIAPFVSLLVWGCLLVSLAHIVDYVGNRTPATGTVDQASHTPMIKAVPPAAVTQPTAEPDILPFFRVCILLLIIIPMASLAAPGYLEPDKDDADSSVLIDGSSREKRLLDALQGKHSIFKNSYRNWLPLQALFITCIFVMGLITASFIFALLADYLLSLHLNFKEMVGMRALARS